jgi:hypothetical protein
VDAEDFAINNVGTVTFNLIARSPGWQAAQLQVTPKKSGVVILPSSQSSLSANITDLRPRNHLYVMTGAVALGVTFALDTTTLADGYHDLMAVAYEGSSVRTQTRIATSIVVTNTPLSATMSMLDLPDISPVQGTYHIQVTANTNNVSTVSLFTTGGILNTVTNQSTATFVVNGPSLGAGLHPFYALVQTSSGLSYRTQTHSVRLIH